MLCNFAIAKAKQSIVARVAKLVDALVSGSSVSRRAGSSPVPGTKTEGVLRNEDSFFLYICVRLCTNKKRICMETNPLLLFYI